MKKLLILILVVLIAWFALGFLGDDTEERVDILAPTEESPLSFRPDPSNGVFSFDDGSVVLKNGKNEREIIPGSPLKEEVSLTDVISYGDINADDKTDAVLVLARSGGGSGIFLYVAGFVSGPVSYKGTNALFLGDRVSPQSITISSGVAKVKYLDRREGEAFAEEPTIERTKEFVFKNGELQER